ncbi:uncharacterized protein YjdB [Paenibacillus anaericanus]|nr:uncharacterized protein YjdB [Paenibacillus anaericanus]
MWTSSKPNVAAVDENGPVSATGKGNTFVTARTQNGELSAVSSVTVAEAATPLH